MRLCLINPRAAATSVFRVKENRFNRYRIFKPLGLLMLARVTPPEWDITVIDENLYMPEYASMPRPDLVGLTAFTSQAERAYEIAAVFRGRGVPVVMGGIHATMCLDEALQRVDAVVTGEAEEVWPHVLEDARKGSLKPVYDGGIVDMERIPPARHDLLPNAYAFGSIQTTRGCPLNCSFCSVSAFNGKRFRRRPIDHVIEEFKLIREKYVIFVDDNLIGTSKEHITRSKELFRAMIQAKLRKRWVGQVTTNMAEDEELLRLAARSGCFGLLIGFESLTDEGLTELNKKFNIRRGGDIASCCRRIQRHGIGVLASFIIGLDVDRKGVGRRIADVACSAGVDVINVQLMTPLPGTQLWETMNAQGRITANSFPEDWKYYTLNYPVASYMHLSAAEMIDEFTSCFASFYSYPRIARRAMISLLRSRRPFATASNLITNLMYRGNLKLERDALEHYRATRTAPHASGAVGELALDGVEDRCK